MLYRYFCKLGCVGRVLSCGAAFAQAPEVDANPPAATQPYEESIVVGSAETPPPPEVPADENRSSLIGEIVVTAQKREQSSQDVGISISAYSGEALDQLGIQDTAEISDLVPGFTFADSGYSIPIYTIRGVGFNDISQAGSSTVGVYVDEVILPYPAMTKGANLDLQRVEVLKGPQGTLYGRNTTGGAVNFVANRPTQNFESSVSATYGTDNLMDAEGYISGPFGETLAGRLAVRSITADEWQHDYTRPGVKYGKDQRQSARALLDWTPSDALRMALSLDGWIDKSDPRSPQAYVFLDQSAIVGFTPSQAFQDHPLARNDDAEATALDPGRNYYLEENFVNASLRADWDFAEATTFTAIVSTQRYKSDNHFNLDGMNVEEFEYFIESDIPSTTVEARLSGKLLDDSVNWVAGYFFSKDKVDEHRAFLLKDNSTGNGGRTGVFDNVFLDGEQDSTTNAVFGQAEWQATDAYYTSLQRLSDIGVRYPGRSRTFGITLAYDFQ